MNSLMLTNALLIRSKILKKNSNNVKYYYDYIFWIHVKMLFLSVIEKLILSSVSHDSSEIFLISWDLMLKTYFLLLSVENGCAA